MGLRPIVAADNPHLRSSVGLGDTAATKLVADLSRVAVFLPSDPISSLIPRLVQWIAFFFHVG